MKYKNVVEGMFIERPNRFVAICEIGGRRYRCHVKNTGRCRELLTPGTRVYLTDRRGEPAAGRKTDFSLVSVWRGDMLFNIDSQAPNTLAEEAFAAGKIHLPGLGTPKEWKREYTYGHSRLDFWLKNGEQEALMEIKGITLEQNGTALFPDAPTLRGVKHIQELTAAVGDGYLCYILFVLQFSPAREVRPNGTTHPEFGAALREAQRAGVVPIAYCCDVKPGGEVVLTSPVPVNTEDGFKR